MSTRTRLRTVVAANGHRANHLLALLLAGDETLTHAEQLAAVRAAFAWGQERGYQAGFMRSFDERPYSLRAHYEIPRGDNVIPSNDALLGRRGEHPGQPAPGAPRPDDFRGLGEAGAQESLAPQRERDAKAEQLRHARSLRAVS